MFVAGLAGWTLLEYALHGGLAHLHTTFITPIHAVHHRDPHAVFAIGTWLPSAAVLALLLVLFGWAPGVVFYLGVLCGFAAYEVYPLSDSLRSPADADRAALARPSSGSSSAAAEILPGSYHRLLGPGLRHGTFTATSARAIRVGKRPASAQRTQQSPQHDFLVSLSGAQRRFVSTRPCEPLPLNRGCRWPQAAPGAKVPWRPSHRFSLEGIWTIKRYGLR